jgi:diadenosine tetraphosphatase ApaH/serine/threonine PP2A family protein phosphatase
MIAIVSDIHSNIEALTAVLEKCEELGVTEIRCLGDVIGYGPDPLLVSQIAMERFSVSLRGNHEEALVTGRHRFNPYAAKAIDWTRSQLSSNAITKAFGGNRANAMQWHEERKPFELIDNTLMVHGSIYDPVHDYVDEPENPVEAEQMIETLENDFTGFDICFAGHNHTPFLATQVGTLFPHDAHNSFVIPKGHKAYVCVGSVGQPRDRDNRASFATLDGERITFHRVPYDFRSTMRKISDAGLHEFLAERLEAGI